MFAVILRILIVAGSRILIFGSTSGMLCRE